MDGNNDLEIDAVALTVEQIIAQNESVLTEHEEDYTSFSEFQPTTSAGANNLDTLSLFS